ncbi:4a-hydroxytetrahydrobiopterin dehydratase [Bacteroidia bacterium]|nr:4a-hydroxytetrahydrobiopterin dehydratase [Bacteroidia bacterium]MDC1395145.1 4a-hydroxytetrahydrobiopterin dehydratase [Bacteroidia bacterium]
MEWTKESNALHKTYKFKSFIEAIDFMSKSVRSIEALNHHPEWCNIYNKVAVKLTTHDAGNTITEKDRKLAEALDEVYCQYL